MKFTEIKQEEWASIQPYLDTCLLPLTGLLGNEPPWEVAAALRNLRDLMDLVEIPFKGRIVTYPAMHYSVDSELFVAQVNDLCKRMKVTTFKHIILISTDVSIQKLNFTECDLFVGLSLINLSNHVSEKVQSIWSRNEVLGKQ